MSTFYDAHLVLIQGTMTGFLLALSIQIPLRMGVFSFAGAGSYGIGAYAAAELVIHRGFGALEAIFAAAVITAVIGLLLGLVIFRLDGLYLAMATVAFDLIIGVIAINGGTFTGSSVGLYGVAVDFPMTLMFLLTLIVLLIVAWSETGRLGRRIHSVREDPQLAGSVGVNVRRYRLMAFVVSGAAGGLAGSMMVITTTTIGPLDIGFNLIVLALTMIIVGGALSWRGALIGAIIFTWLPTWLNAIGEWQDLAYGIIVSIAAVLLPRGLNGVIVDGVRMVRRRRRDGDSPAVTAVPDKAPLDSNHLASAGALAQATSENGRRS